MTLIAHDLVSKPRPTRQRDRRPATAAAMARSHLAAIRRAVLLTAAILLAGAGLAAIIGVRTALSFSRYHLGAG